MRKISALFFCAFLLSSCASDDPTPVKFQNAQSPRIVLDVASINVIDHSEFQPSDSPYSRYQLDPKIADAVRQWVSATLVAGGSRGQAIVVIKDGSLSAQNLPMSDEMGDRMFKRQQAMKYTGHADVEVEISDSHGYQVASAEASRFVTLPEDPSQTERQNAYIGMLGALMNELTKNLTASIHQHMQASISG